MRAGVLRHRVELWSYEIERSTTGDASYSWSRMGTLWAQISPLRGKEAASARQINATVTHRIITRYLAGVKARDRFIWGDRTFEIISVRNIDERNRMLEIDAEELAE